jgi:lipoyl-dependent peroxiredoxin
VARIQKVLTTGKTHTSFSDPEKPRGHASHLDIALTAPGLPKLAHSFDSAPSHPTAEQLFAGAWSACYIIALTVAAEGLNETIPSDTTVEVEVDLGVTGADYFVQARLFVKLPGLEQDIAETIAHRADEICVYSKATRDNIDVTFTVTT